MKPLSSLLIIFLICFGQIAHAQDADQIRLKARSVPGLHITGQGSGGLKAVNNLERIRLENRQTPRGVFQKLQTEGFLKSFRKGYPDLPVKTRLIQIPAGAEVNVKIEGYDEEIIRLGSKGISGKLMPGQPSVPKSSDEDRFHYNEKIYETNDYLGDEIVKVEEIGVMRGIRFGRLIISPFQYNPVQNKLKVINNLDFEITFSGAKSSQTVKSSTNPYFKSIANKAINNNSIGGTSAGLASDKPVTYVIVSPPEFKEQLEPFVGWKRKKGFHVIEGYTDSIGNTRTEIRTFLKDLYENPPVSPPSFVLLVGDVEQIPSWNSRTYSTHVTDLYYCEYTDDILPEAYYGRIPARDTAELRQMVKKTLEYEKYELSDPSYLEDALLVAGNDEGYEDTYANGQINYGTSYYFNAENGINAHAFLQDPPNGNNAVHDSIIQNMNRGLGFATYTAHCLSSGWSNPGFQLDDISSLTSNGKYGLWISNCCWSLKFDNPECFGEAAIRASGKGAIGAIGASDESYWDEDYWWGVGVTSSILSNPTYEESELGLYDRMFHTHDEEVGEWYVTQGQMVAAGNLAVEATSSNLKDYYWEVYHLLGDPSLMPYFGIPSSLSVSHFPSKLTPGIDSLTVNTEPYAYVALSFKGELLDAESADDAGVATLSFPELQENGEVDLVVTAQNRKPYIKTAYITPFEEPYLILDHTDVYDSTGNGNGAIDYGETIGLDVVLENVSDSFAAFGVTDSLYSNDPSVEVIDNYLEFGEIQADTLSDPGRFRFSVSDSVKDQQDIEFEMDIKGKDAEGADYSWHSAFRLKVNAPSLTIGDMILDDGPMGNDSLDPGDTVDIHIVIHNQGHSAIDQVKGILSLDNQMDYLSVNDSVSEAGLIGVNASDTVTFGLAANPDSPEGIPVYLNIEAIGGSRGQYSSAETKRIILGETPIYRMGDQNDVITDYGLFYDSGGPEGDYGNKELYRITFTPATEGKAIEAYFKSFDVEKDYDTLRVYDGTSTKAPVIGKFHNGAKPGRITAKNNSGSLTFEFYSDYSVIASGWKAEIAGVPRDTITFSVFDNDSPLKDAVAVLDGDTSTTDSNGQVSFVRDEGTYQYDIHREGYDSISGVLEVSGNIEKKFFLEKKLYHVTFELYEPDGKTSLNGTVSLDGSEISTDQGSCTFEDIWSFGSHSYHVNVSDYQDYSGELQLNSDTTIIVKLEKRAFPIMLSVRNDDDQSLDSVKVRLDTLQKYTDKSGTVSFRVFGGSYPLQLSKDQYTEYSVELHVNDSTAMDVQLFRLYDVRFAVMSKADSQLVSHAQIQIDTFELQTDSMGSARTELTKGNYGYTVEADGYDTYQSSMEVNDDLSVELLLTKVETGGDALKSGNILIYPNPANGKVQIRNETGIFDLEVRIYNLTGEVIYSGIVGDSHISIDLSDHPEGMYLIQMNSGDQQITRKLILR